MFEEQKALLRQHLSAYAQEKGIQLDEGDYHGVYLFMLSWQSNSLENVIQISMSLQSNTVVLKHLSGLAVSAKSDLLSMLSSFLPTNKVTWKDYGMLPEVAGFLSTKQFLDKCYSVLEEKW